MPVKIMVTCVFLISSIFAQDQMAVTTKVFGNVEIFKKKGTSLKLKQGSILSIGDQIKTSRGSFAAIIFIVLTIGMLGWLLWMEHQIDYPEPIPETESEKQVRQMKLRIQQAEWEFNKELAKYR